MADLKIRVYKDGGAEPDTTVTIPGGVLRIAKKLIPARAMDAMQEQGVDLDEIIALSESPDFQGTVAQVDDHKKNERVVIALE